MKRKGIKTLVASLIAIVICFTMLIGTTFAWFTDSVTSSNNIIASGVLDVNAYWMEGDKDPSDENNWVKFNGDPIFNYEKWEPGYVEAKHIKIANEGSLAFEYKVVIAPNGEVSALADVIDVYFLDKAQAITRETITRARKVGTLADLIADKDGAARGILLPAETTPNDLETEEVGSVAVSLAFKMQETAGNEYLGLSIGTNFDIQIFANQYDFEADSFGKDYDNDAKYPQTESEWFFENSQDMTLRIGDVAVTVPKGAEAGSYRLEVANVEESINEETEETSLSMDISLFNGNEKASGEEYPVEIYVGELKKIVSVSHNGQNVTGYTYNALTGVISFATSSFSPFEVVSTDLEVESSREDIISEVDGQHKIVSGTFTGVNPAELDPSLVEDDSAYMVVEYVEGGEQKYVVAEKATTVVLNPTDHSGKLWSQISALQNNEHSTVFLRPGTYNEGTTINVYSSMDIIGLGDKEDIKVVKQSSSSSNRHLFNVNGTKADYIEVTISNMTLDATAKITNSKDNAAVQSIRKSKVKCYNLDIVKGTGLDAIAFYVNGNNAVDGVKYPAYLYVENCTLNTTRTFGIVTTAGTYKFYHTNLTYGGADYTQNSGSIKKVQMEASNWDWEN